MSLTAPTGGGGGGAAERIATGVNAPATNATGAGPAASSGAATKPDHFRTVSLTVGVALALALADTRAAPLVMAVLAAGIVYQVLNF